MNQLSGRAHGPAFSSNGETVAAEITADGLVLCPGEVRAQRVAWDTITLRSGGFHGDTLLLEWPDLQGKTALSLSDAEVHYVLLTRAPAAIVAQLAQVNGQQRRSQRRSRVGWVVLIFLLLSPVLLVLVFWWQSSRIIDWAVSHITIEMEQQLGEAAFAQSTLGMKMLDHGPAVDFVRQTGELLTKGSAYHFQWHVVDSPVVNAFAVPGGHVVVFTGLLKSAQTPEEVAGVLAHETQHVLQRHSLRAMVQAIGWQAVVSLAIGNVGSGMAEELATQLGTLKFSRSQENDADAKGVALLRQAQISPEGMLNFFERMSKQKGPQLAILSTHPPSDERLAALREILHTQGQYPNQPLMVDWPALQAGLVN
ncbi:MAG: M48 family metallopeptidase [Gammaproteobacteria bacterium]|nr:M48 family metallopeptidase [Gammaproteobacteria bacterium]